MSNSMHRKLIEGKEKLAVIGLGYVGLPIALEFARKMNVIGFDINDERVELMKNKIDPSNELEASDFEGCSIEFTSKHEVLGEAKVFIVAVPTPIDESKRPDLRPLLGASKSVGGVLKKDDYVIFESTVYPGCTEEDCIPVLEKESGLKAGIDFKVGYSPERINPGDKVHNLKSVIKVVSGIDEEALEEIAKIYGEVVTKGIHRASSIKVAEAAKIIENTQRDVNISLINELSIIFDRLGINTYDVLEAAETKWNFLKFQPGLVGGHCIGVDPYYLLHKAKQSGYHAEVINSGRSINDYMGFYIGKKTVKLMIAEGKNMNTSKVLVMGATFKENVSDVRNSKVIDVVNELTSFSVKVDLTDPNASSKELEREYGIGLSENIGNDYDAIIIAVNHKEYLNLKEEDFKTYLKDGKGVFIDIKGTFKGKIKDLEYWSL